MVLLFLQIEYSEGNSEVYLLPIKWTSHIEVPRALIAQGSQHYLMDANWSASYRQALAELILGRSEWTSATGRIVAEHGKAIQELHEIATLPSRVLGVEQSNTSVVFGDRLFCKLYRKIEDGENPDVEITRYLTETLNFPHVPSFIAALKYQREDREPQDLGLVQRLVANEGDAWSWTLRSLAEFYQRAAGQVPKTVNLTQEMIGREYAERIALLGRRTAELHIALAAPGDPRFTPEPLTLADQDSLFQSMRKTTQRSLKMLKAQLKSLRDPVRANAERVASQHEAIFRIQWRVSSQPIDAVKIRVHGDYHLGQVLFTGDDFVIIDFEGEPARSLSERKVKTSPLKDVAGMLRSFHYAAHSALLQNETMTAEESRALQPWAELWSDHIGKKFLQAYVATLTGLIPSDGTHFEILLQAFLLEKAAYEVAYELNNRPGWLYIPLKGIERILARTRSLTAPAE